MVLLLYPTRPQRWRPCLVGSSALPTAPLSRQLLMSLFLAASLLLSRVVLEPDVPLHDPATSLWRLRGPAPPKQQIELTVQVLVDPQNRAKLEETFWAVSYTHLTLPTICSV